MNKSPQEKYQWLLSLIKLSIIDYKQFQFSFWGQLILGSLYSFGYFDSYFAALFLGLVIPSFWILLTYKYLKYKHESGHRHPFPSWMTKNPGNNLIVILDIVFLAFIWTIILSGLYEAFWLKFFFTVVLPILSLAMLRNMVILPTTGEECTQEETQSPKDHETNDKTNSKQ